MALTPKNSSTKGNEKRLSLGSYYMICICCLLMLVSIVNVFIVIQHLSNTFITVPTKMISLSPFLGRATMTILDSDSLETVKKTLYDHSNLRSNNKDLTISITDDSKKKQESTEKKGGEQKKKVTKRINPTGDGIHKKLKPTDKDNQTKTKTDEKKKESIDKKDKKKEGSIDTKENIDKMKESAEGVIQTIQASNATNFVRHDNVVIATKIHGSHQWSLLVQSMCLFHYAYNQQLQYDIVAFATEPVADEDIKALQDMLAPVKFSLVVDNNGLQNEMAALPPETREGFLKRCNVTDGSTLDWFSNCDGHRLAYNWQAEFRSKRLWRHPSLKEYKTMLWIDADGFATEPWSKDPIDYFIKNDGVIMFDNFPQSRSSFKVQKKLISAFNKTICGLKLSEETGNLLPKLGTPEECGNRGIPNVHGFFHITKLDFFRSDVVTKALDVIFDNCFLQREPDDQFIVTAIPAILAPERSWDMRSKGFNLGVYHNFKLDGLYQAKPAGFKGYWNEVARHILPAADGVCKITEAN